MEELKKIIEVWKAKGISRAEMEFTAGGDSMGDTYWNIFDADDKRVEEKEIEDYLDREVYHSVMFYTNSDGEYMGESGTVYVQLEDGEDDFHFHKVATSEFNRYYDKEMSLELNNDFKNFLNEYVSRFDGDADGFRITYKKDLIYNEVFEAIENDLKKYISENAQDFDVNGEGEIDDMFSEFEFVRIADDQLYVRVTKRYYQFQDSE